LRKKTKYVAGEIGRVRVIEDFLPSAKALAKRKSKATAKRLIGGLGCASRPYGLIYCWRAGANIAI
jgi:hypothetical protein